MKKLYYIYLFCALFVFSLSYINTIMKTKDKPMEQGQTLDLKEFKKSDTGFFYQVIKNGNGIQSKHGQMVTVHYSGHLLDGTDKVGKFFDSSVRRNQPFKFNVGKGQVIKGWDQALSMMHVGDKWLVMLPSNLAYGSQNVGGGLIPANSTLLFEIELLAVG